jgi:Tfp pilus assembly protein PilF
VSTDARTFDPPPDDWTPSGDWKSPSAVFAGSPQTLIGDLIREGVTGVAGHVSEPYLESLIRPQILFPTYLEGFNLAEAYYLAMPSLSWQTVVIGDPLCVPFPRRALTRADIEDPIEKNSGLPGIFRDRRLEVLRTSVLRVSFKDVPQEALDAFLAADAREIVGDLAGARLALEQTTALAPKAVAAQLRLAMVYGRLQEYRKAVERYQIVIEAQPQNPMALNNLAYALGVHLKTPEQALPFARRALAVAPESPVVLDTVGWIEHLSGNTATAAKLLTDASRRNPDNAEIRLHAAIVSAAAGSPAEGEAHLKEALRLDPSLAKRQDVVSLQRKLSEPRK